MNRPFSPTEAVPYDAPRTTPPGGPVPSWKSTALNVAAWLGTLLGLAAVLVARKQGVAAHPWAFGFGFVALTAGTFRLVQQVPALRGPVSTCPGCGRETVAAGVRCEKCSAAH